MSENSGALKPGKYFMNGDQACVEGAILAGCRFFAGYPITPSSEIFESACTRFPQVGGNAIEMEDEISSVAAIIGASFAGAKVMTATSGPGFSLMMENIGLAYMMEAPSVLVDVQRAGPSTGIPTLVGQGDMMQAKWGSHGGIEAIAYSPSSVQEFFDLTIQAFNTAEKFRTPVFVLADQVVGMMWERFTVPPVEELEIIDRKTMGPATARNSDSGDIVISEDPIDYPRISSLDGLLTMYQKGLDSNVAMVKPKGVILVERKLVDSSRDRSGKRILSLPAMATAEGLGRKILMNVVLLGSLVATTYTVSVESIQRAVAEEFPKYSELNLRALDAGFDLAKNYDHEAYPHSRNF